MHAPLLQVSQTAVCGLMPHPPIVLPSVGHEHAARCAATRSACERFAELLVASGPSRVLLVSPHAPRHRDAFGLSSGPVLRGDLGEFDADDVRVELPADEELAAAIAAAAAQDDVPCWRFSGATLDHGAVVPLAFLVAAGWRGPTVVASLPWQPRPDAGTAFGHAIGRARHWVAGGTSLVASGDLSRRLEVGAPAGFHPRAAELDERVRLAVEGGALEELASIDAHWREQAAEDALDSAAVIVAALPRERRGTRVLSYEHPFGVGYLVAVFHAGDAPALARG